MFLMTHSVVEGVYLKEAFYDRDSPIFFPKFLIYP